MAHSPQSASEPCLSRKLLPGASQILQNSNPPTQPPRQPSSGCGGQAQADATVLREQIPRGAIPREMISTLRGKKKSKLRSTMKYHISLSTLSNILKWKHWQDRCETSTCFAGTSVSWYILSGRAVWGY